YMTKQAIDTIGPFLDGINIDLKAMNDAFYKDICNGRLQPVLDNIRYLKQAGIWLEVTTLIVPKANDREEELHDIAQFIADVDPDIPWHVSRFHPDYQYTDAVATPLSVMEAAFNFGKHAGLHYVYMGNIINEDKDTRNTRCPQCMQPVIQRDLNRVKMDLAEKNRCPGCGAVVAGVYE
ncbi:MAG: radical SAM protein, partial [Desulfotignum sp.]